MTIHRWFRSGGYQLLAHADLPDASGDLGLVMVSPFGWEDVCAYRPLRILARVLADRGIPVLRYDLPGTGDSSGGPRDPNLVSAWIDSVNDAAAELRVISGVRFVAVLGIRLGGMLAAAAASVGADVQDLILWGTAASGRSEMRELRAYANMERWEFGNGNEPRQPVEGFEVGGFVMSPDTQRDIEALDLARLSNLGNRRVLILSRDDLAPDAKLAGVFESAGCEVRRSNGMGYAAMMNVPHEAVAPIEGAKAIAEFLAAPQRLHAIRGPSGPDGARIGAAHEKIVSLGSGIFGILAEPARKERAECCVLYLNAGGVRHIGPNRMWVDAARSGAEQGIASLRLDLRGIGESEGGEFLDIPALYQEELVEQVQEAITVLRTRFGFHRFAVVGLCAGAFWAFHAAMRNRDVCSAILLNPRLFFWDPEVDRRRMMRRGARSLVSPKDWWRLVRGGIQVADLTRAARLVFARSKETIGDTFSRRQIPPKKMADAWKRILRNQSRVTLVFTEGEPLLREMEEERQMPPADPRIQLIRVPSCGHTFRPQWSQSIVSEIIRRELGLLVSARGGEHVLKLR